MDLSSAKWMSEMEMDVSAHAFINQWQYMSSIEDSVDSFPYKSFPSNTIKAPPRASQYSFEKPIITQVEQKPWKSCPSDQKASSSSSTIISFANSDSPRATANNYYENSKFFVKPEMETMSLENLNPSLENPYGSYGFDEGVKKGVTRTPAQAQDHVLAERKRRERMTQRFVALSAVIPGLKKLDKGTVLGDAINYIKELQERVKKLEEDVNRNNNNEEIIHVGAKRPRITNDDASSSDESNFFDHSSSDDHSSPEIEVRASEGNVLLRVYCKQQTGIVKEILGELERHELTLVSSSIIPFGDSRLHMTIIAQMADESLVTAKTLVDNLRMGIQTLI